MMQKELASRIVHKHDIATNWNKATTFIPKQGEMIVYDIDDLHDYERIKIGDGKTIVSSLPFVTYSRSEIDNMELVTVADIDAICGTTIIDATNNSEVTF